MSKELIKGPHVLRENHAKRKAAFQRATDTLSLYINAVQYRDFRNAPALSPQNDAWSHRSLDSNGTKNGNPSPHVIYDRLNQITQIIKARTVPSLLKMRAEFETNDEIGPTVNDYLKKQRQKKGLSLSELARISHMKDAGTVWNIENDMFVITDPTLTMYKNAGVQIDDSAIERLRELQVSSPQTVGEFMYRIRKYRGIEIRHFTGQTGVSRTSLHHAETNKHIATDALIAAFEDYFGVKVPVSLINRDAERRRHRNKIKSLNAIKRNLPPQEKPTSLGAFLRMQRLARNISAVDMATYTCITDRQIGNIERNLSRASSEVLDVYEDVLKITIPAAFRGQNRSRRIKAVGKP